VSKKVSATGGGGGGGGGRGRLAINVHRYKELPCESHFIFPIPPNIPISPSFDNTLFTSSYIARPPPLPHLTLLLTFKGRPFFSRIIR